MLCAALAMPEQLQMERKKKWQNKNVKNVRNCNHLLATFTIENTIENN